MHETSRIRKNISHCSISLQEKKSCTLQQCSIKGMTQKYQREVFSDKFSKRTRKACHANRNPSRTTECCPRSAVSVAGLEPSTGCPSGWCAKREMHDHDDAGSRRQRQRRRRKQNQHQNLVKGPVGKAHYPMSRSRLDDRRSSPVVERRGWKRLAVGKTEIWDNPLRRLRLKSLSSVPGHVRQISETEGTLL